MTPDKIVLIFTSAMQTFACFFRDGNGAKFAPTQTQPKPNCICGQVIIFRPISNYFSFIVDCNIPVTSFVAGLFGFCSPMHVSFFVMTVIVFAINRMLWGWSSSDFGKEFFVRVEKKLNSASRVMSKTACLWISITAPFCCYVSTIFSGFACFLMFYIMKSITLAAQTTAGFSISRSESEIGENFDLAAITFTNPEMGSAT